MKYLLGASPEARLSNFKDQQTIYLVKAQDSASQRTPLVVAVIIEHFLGLLPFLSQQFRSLCTAGRDLASVVC